MQVRGIKVSLCVMCLGLAAVVGAQSKTLSVLERVQNVDDPELGELIRAAIEKRAEFYRSNREETLELIRKVTVNYTQIKLLDRQIQEVGRKLEGNAGPPEMRYELLLAKTELEAKLAERLAELRGVMGIIPKHPFEEQPLEILNAWICLQPVEQGVFVLEGLKTFQAYWALQRHKSSGLLPDGELLDLVRERLTDRRNLPIRIDIRHTAAMRSSAEDLRAKVISLAREANAQMEVEVRLEPITWVGSGESTFFLRDNTIRTLHAAQVQRPDGRAGRLASGLVEPNDLDQHILWRLMFPGSVPLRFRIEHDEASAELARQTADAIRAVARDVGAAKVVDVAEELVASPPETAFLGRWQAVTKGEIETIHVQPGGVCVLAMSAGSASPRAGANAPGTWFLTTREIIMDVKERSGPNSYVHRGRLDKEGHLVVEKGVIFPQGSFHTASVQLMVFKKVY